jgi:hypothetical protein
MNCWFFNFFKSRLKKLQLPKIQLAKRILKVFISVNILVIRIDR